MCSLAKCRSNRTGNENYLRALLRNVSSPVDCPVVMMRVLRLNTFKITS